MEGEESQVSVLKFMKLGVGVLKFMKLREGGSQRREHERIWLIHVAIWHKPVQHRKAIILQFKTKSRSKVTKYVSKSEEKKKILGT